MGDAPEQEASHGDVDHGFGDVEAGLVVAHEAMPAGHPSEGPFDHPAAWLDLEALLARDLAHDLDGEVPVGGGAGELARSLALSANKCFSHCRRWRTALMILSAPAASCMSAAVRLTMSSRPSVSTAMWRLRPFTFLAAS